MNLYLIGNAHIDPVWLWRWHEGVAEVLATFRSALDRIKEFPGFKFTCACASYYEWVEKLDPEMFEEIKQRVKEGRWNVVGGWYLQPDCNMPDGESFARHALVAQRYFKEKFGVTAKTGYNVDSFGHNANLPKILKLSGMDNYIFSRPSTAEQGWDKHAFVWESDDGSRVNAYRNPTYYNINIGNYREEFLRVKELAEKEGVDFAALYGVGNHGGGPTIQLIDAINKFDLGAEKVFCTADEYFESLDKDKLPVLHDELQHHARGCYSAESRVKASNRKCEQNLLNAEKMCVLAEKLTGEKYPKNKLKKAWKNLLFNQFHDILCGCSVKEAYNDANHLFGETMSITEQIIGFAMQRIAWNIDTLGDVKLPSYKNSMRLWEHEVLGTPVVVFNLQAWPVKQIVRVNQPAKKVTDCDGCEIPFQIVRADYKNGSSDNFSTEFIAEIPPMGYSVYRVFYRQESEASFENEFTSGDNILENNKIKVEFDCLTGDISRMYDKKKGCYIIEKPCRAVLLDETASDTWAHNDKNLGEVAGVFEKPVFKVIEEGTVKKTIRVTTYCGDSILQRDYTLMAGDERVSVNTKADIRDKHRTLKLTFPLTDEKVVAKIPYGTITRCGYTGEEPCGSWFASGNLCIANDSKYGYDTEDDEMRLSALRTGVYADHYGQEERDETCEYMEQGEREFKYSLFAYSGNADAEKKASELNTSVMCVPASFHKGSLPEKYCGLECDSDDVIVSAIKKCEDSDENLVRFYEMNGESTSVKIKLFDREIASDAAPHQVKTLTESGSEVNLIEW